MEYLMCTNIYNEKDRIEKTFKMVSEFTLKPKKWVWIVDGSTDGSELEVERCAGIYDINVYCQIFPPKEEGDLTTIGRAYDYLFKSTNILNEQYGFMSIIDVDNDIHKDYMKEASEIFETESNIGIISGHHPMYEVKMPLGNGKCVRWEIVIATGDCWDISPDTYFNIKARKMGYEWKILKDEVGKLEGPPSGSFFTEMGAENAGWQWAYVCGSWTKVIVRTLYRMLRRRHGISYLKGFMRGKREGRICEDCDVKEFYGRD